MPAIVVSIQRVRLGIWVCADMIVVYAVCTPYYKLQFDAANALLNYSYFQKYLPCVCLSVFVLFCL
jgi:hypothetical protein